MDRDYADWLFDQECAEDDRLRDLADDAWHGPLPVVTDADRERWRLMDEKIAREAQNGK